MSIFSARLNTQLTVSQNTSHCVEKLMASLVQMSVGNYNEISPVKTSISCNSVPPHVSSFFCDVRFEKYESLDTGLPCLLSLTYLSLALFPWFSLRIIRRSWWCHQMETFSALLALCVENSSVTGEFPAQRPVTGSFGVFFDLCLNKPLSKQSWGWWLEMPSRSSWRHCNV